MGFFDHLQKGGAFSLQAKKPQIRKVVTQKKPAPQSQSRSSSAGTTDTQASRRTPSIKSKHVVSQHRETHASSKQRLKATISRGNLKRPSPIQRLSSDDDDESDTDASFEVRKRTKLSNSVEPDLSRHIRSAEAFSEDGPKELTMVHAAEITIKKAPGKYKPAFEKGTKSTFTEITLRYPSIYKGERYQLAVPKENDDFKPLDDIVQVVEMVSQNYIPEDALEEFDHETTGIKRRIRRAFAHASEEEFRDVIADYNRAVQRSVSDGSIAKHLDKTHALRLPLVERILTQIYSRTVSPRVESLRQYENGTDNVYGELLPRFISTIFRETQLKSGQVFVDLGSGVGNVVLQAALEIGCESWGCEMMPNACTLADLQRAEFKARCRLWGITPGETRLVQGDFLAEQSILEVLKRADVVLINNQAFTPQLNNELINHFLDMKEGCKIVSLKSFVPAGHKITSRNLNSPINLLDVRRLNYWSDSVSWTDVGGTYFIATKDSSRLKAFADSQAF
ncbi:Histone-lysine N-methyltransferase, H3 lysine-79 specific [Talaromyces atroroseus]|uniref:Histone-lysine N-methyltransferase, H3 lysine-79 specific n=1 Tax=Talaromyces atroroseus TaxID=1441469 RepID=A0A1Q5Q7E8_TALAT|nr:Histone-lysine N-methyltransferase, H3 lysine-79 specific [Talaromyces atroroseus]OKL56149.1 Histone-lysine N-methyltransferase, H3 lysine-79 specific [Talaromyces atroroseus]